MTSEVGDMAARLHAEFPSALRDGQVVGHFQPEVELPTGRLAGAELLARWEHPELGTLPPSMFTSLAEELGLMREFSLRMLRQALAQHRAWAAAGCLVPVSVNVGPSCVADPSFPAAVAKLLREEQVPGQMLTLEVSEETGTAAATTTFFAQLAESGVKISLDDFGTGFASLESLGGWPIDELKLDRSLVRQIVSSASFRTIVHTTIDLAHELGATVVAEGVESAAVSSELRVLGCDIGQGFFLGRPMTAANFTDWMLDPVRLIYAADLRLPAAGPRTDLAAPRERLGGAADRAVRALRRAVQPVGGGALTAAVVMLAIYGLWQVFRWGGPEHQALIGDLAFVPVNGAAVVLAWRASRRADLGRRTGQAWRLLRCRDIPVPARRPDSAGLRGRAAPAARSELGRRRRTSSFYPVAFCGLVLFPTHRRSGAERLRLLLELGTVFIGGAIIIWYLALGPAVASGPDFSLPELVIFAYPVGDLVLLFGVLTVLWRGAPQSSTMALRIFAVGMLSFIAADLTYDYITAYSTYNGGDPVDTLWMVALTVLYLAAACQVAHQAGRKPPAAAGGRSRPAVAPALPGHREQFPALCRCRLARRQVRPAGRHPARGGATDLHGQRASVHRPARLRPACAQIPGASRDRRHHRPVQPPALHGSRGGRLRARPASWASPSPR